ncbi:Possible glycosyltransferase [hydrothermal vent metagenome]|uniref:Possible glycosyltransferase n=1 Tax=hydrothermal vent metagenome TaxID=652676 RepID=A0A3B1EAA0_9ZZZZ
MKILYVKNNSERAKEFQLKTIIFEENGKKFVKKQILCDEAIPHLKKMKDSYIKLTLSIVNPKIKLAKIIDETKDSLTFEFIDGISLEKRFDDAKKQGKDKSNQIIDEYIKLLKTGFKTTTFDSKTMITNKYKKIFGNLDYSKLDGELCFDGISNIDLIFSNIIYKDDEIYLIDYEWVFDLSISVSYISFRSFHKPQILHEQMENNFINNIVVGNNGFYKIQNNYSNSCLNIMQQIQDKDKQIQDKDKQIQDKDKQIQDKDQDLNNLLNSRSIKITRPLRQFSFAAKTLLNFKKDKLYIPGTAEHIFAQAIKRRIPENLFLKIKGIIRKKISQNLRDMPWNKPLTSISKDLGQRVLIIAELSLPQCKKYRVDQKIEMLHSLNYDTIVVSWTDFNQARNQLQLAGIVIFYRVPAHDIVKRLLEETNRLGVISFFDVDDLIFDKELLKDNINIQQLDKKIQEELFNGADLYQDALSLTQHSIASTPVLAEYMKKYNKGKCYVMPNCLDNQLLQYVEKTTGNKNGFIKIVYGSGTSTHDIDFLEASDALVLLLKKYKNLQFVVHGTLNLPKSFDAVQEQILQIPFMEANDYYQALQSYDINIAPLEKGLFNDAKSNIKFLEASVFKLPTVASPVTEYSSVIDHGKNGLLASSKQEWTSALESLILSETLRLSIGEKAYLDALKHFNIKSIADKYFLPLLKEQLPKQQMLRKKILMANVLFNPISFGGATIVIEELSKLINKNENYDVTVFTGFFDSSLTLPNAYDITRYEINGVSVILVRFAEPMLPEMEYKNELMEPVFDDILKSIHPDLVHFHSIQQLSASIALPCKKRNIPYIITLHDMWWLCEKQFMVMPNNKYCNQTKIDINYCINHCSHNAEVTNKRNDYLKPILNNAALLLTPSKFQADMYSYNGIAVNNIRVNKNGIQFPSKRFKKTKSNKVRFAYLGGNAVHKGYNFIKDIFESIEESNYELILVDLHRKLGRNSIFESDWNIKGQLSIVDGYEYGQKGLDSFFKDIDVLLFPSQGKESFGLTVREALVRDVWVITTDAGGVTEDIVDGENGNIVSMNDKEEFREKIKFSISHSLFYNDYKNPYKGQITSFSKQAAELIMYYKGII